MTYDNMANVELEPGNFPKALERFEKSLEIKRQALGDSRMAASASGTVTGVAAPSLGQRRHAGHGRGHRDV